MSIKPETVKRIGLIASCMSVAMYVSYIPQIMDNLSGTKGNPIQPLVAFLNCILWTVYGFQTRPVQKPILIANIPGIILAAVCAVTSF